MPANLPTYQQNDMGMMFLPNLILRNAYLNKLIPETKEFVVLEKPPMQK